MKNAEYQIEKQQKAIRALINDQKAALGSNASGSGLASSVTEESMANLAVSINAEQKEKTTS